MGTATAILVVLVIVYLAVTSFVHGARQRRAERASRPGSGQSN